MNDIQPGPDAVITPPDYNAIISSAAQKYGVPVNFALAIHSKGEQYNPKNNVSPKGATGPMQIMPDTFNETAKKLGISNPNINDPDQNAEVGVYYLKEQLDKFKGNQKLAAAAYNAGPGAVEKANGVPNFHETKGYANRVMDIQPAPGAKIEPPVAEPSAALQAQPQAQPAPKSQTEIDPFEVPHTDEPYMPFGGGSVEALKDIVAPALPIAGAAAGAAAAIPSGPVGMVAGGGLGYAAGKQGQRAIEEFSGQTKPERGLLPVANAIKDVIVGGAYSAAGPEAGILKSLVDAGVSYATASQIEKAYNIASDQQQPENLRDQAKDVLKNFLVGAGLAGVFHGAIEAPELIKKGAGKAAERLSESALKIPPSLPESERGAAVKAQLEGGYMPTSKGMRQLKADTSETHAQVGQIIDSLTQSGRTINAHDAFNAAIDDAEKAYSAYPPDRAAQFIEPLEKLREQYLSGEAILTPKQAQELKEKLNRDLEGRKGFTEDEKRESITRGEQGIRRQLRQALEELHPEIKNLNAKNSARIKLMDALERASHRIRNLDITRMGFRSGMGGVVGYLLGGWQGAEAGAVLANVLDDPLVKSKLAVALHRASKIGEKPPAPTPELEPGAKWENAPPEPLKQLPPPAIPLGYEKPYSGPSTRVEGERTGPLAATPPKSPYTAKLPTIASEIKPGEFTANQEAANKEATLIHAASLKGKDRLKPAPYKPEEKITPESSPLIQAANAPRQGGSPGMQGLKTIVQERETPKLTKLVEHATGRPESAAYRNKILGYNKFGEPVYQWRIDNANRLAMQRKPYDAERVQVVSAEPPASAKAASEKIQPKSENILEKPARKGVERKSKTTSKEGNKMAWTTKIKEAPKVEPKKLTESQLEVMRSIRQKADYYTNQGRELSPKSGSIAAGSEHVRASAKGDALATFLREISKGKTPEDALALAKETGAEWARNWNNKRPKDFQTHIAEMHTDSILEDAYRKFVNAKGESPKPETAKEPELQKSEAAKASLREQKISLLKQVDDAILTLGDEQSGYGKVVKANVPPDRNYGKEVSQRVIPNALTFKIGEAKYQIANDKTSLQNFRKQIINNFPTGEKEPPAGILKQANRIVSMPKHLEGDEVSYYNEYQPKRATLDSTLKYSQQVRNAEIDARLKSLHGIRDRKVLEVKRNALLADKKSPNSLITTDGFVTDNKFAIKPLTKPSGMQKSDFSVEDRFNGKTSPAKEVYETKAPGQTNIPLVHIVSENGGESLINAKYADTIMTAYPDAKIELMESEGYQIPVFISKDKIVGVVFPRNESEYVSSYIQEQREIRKNEPEQSNQPSPSRRKRNLKDFE